MRKVYSYPLLFVSVLSQILPIGPAVMCQGPSNLYAHLPMGLHFLPCAQKMNGFSQAYGSMGKRHRDLQILYHPDHSN